MEACAGVSETSATHDGLWPDGKRPCSSRLLQRTPEPSPSPPEHFDQAAASPRNTNTCPEKGILPRAPFAPYPLSPVNPRRMSVPPATILILVPAARPIMPATLSAPPAALRYPPRPVESHHHAFRQLDHRSCQSGFGRRARCWHASPPRPRRTASNPGTSFSQSPRALGDAVARRTPGWRLPRAPAPRGTADAPGARVSSTIWRFNSRLRCRLFASVGALREDTLSINAGLEVSIYSPSGHP